MSRTRKNVCFNGFTTTCAKNLKLKQYEIIFTRKDEKPSWRLPRMWWASSVQHVERERGIERYEIVIKELGISALHVTPIKKQYSKTCERTTCIARLVGSASANTLCSCRFKHPALLVLLKSG